jgi:P27 family predicted phage terminase small subunit
MRRGPKRQPVALHRVHGTFRTDRHGGKDPRPKGELLEPPDWLSSAQKKRFRQILRDAPPKLLRRWDAGLLASYVVTEAIIAETNIARCSEAGRHLLELNSKGTMNMNPLLKIQSRFIPIMRALGSELGFSPSSRAGLRLPEEQEHDPESWRWDQILESNRRDNADRVRLWREKQERETEGNKVLRPVKGGGFQWVDEETADSEPVELHADAAGPVADAVEPEPGRIIPAEKPEVFRFETKNEESSTDAEETTEVQADPRPVEDGGAPGVVEDLCGISPAGELSDAGVRQGLEETEEPLAPGTS